jgi:hypothetical protein
MNLYATKIKALSPIDGDMKTYCGPHVPGISFADAQDYCERNGLGYCEVDGVLISEIPCKDGTYEPDWRRRVDYDVNNLN